MLVCALLASVRHTVLKTALKSPYCDNDMVCCSHCGKIRLLGCVIFLGCFFIQCNWLKLGGTML